MKRRSFIKGGMAASVAAVAAGAGLLTPSTVLAAWPKEQFEAKSVEAAVGSFEHSDDIKIKAPDIAENGAVVPVSVVSSIAGATSVSILAANNPSPMTCKFDLGEGAIADVSTRIKMGKTSDVVAVVAAGGKQYANKKEVKVTIGGCGG
ncbi:MAG: thiosulfate oxidation carrier protein SoxY [Gammaproteobacteria bacterium]